MSNTPSTERGNQTLILTGIRDNLLKPMAEEICAKTEEQIKSLRKLLWWGIGIAVLSALANIALIIAVVKCK